MSNPLLTRTEPPATATGAPGSRPFAPRVLAWLWAFVGSFGFACVLLGILLVLTYLGTLAQTSRPIHDVQREYFESLVVVARIGPIPLILPGAYLVIALLLINLVVGGIVRLRKGRATLGVLITHVGIIVLLLGSYVEHSFSDKGYIRLYEKESTDEFHSHYDWEVAVVEHTDARRSKEFVIAQDRFDDLDGANSRRFESPALPFAIRLQSYARNARPKQATSANSGVDGFMLEVLKESTSDNRPNVPGLLASVLSKEGTKRRAILWGLQRMPWTVTVDGRRFAFELRRQSWPLGEEGQRFSIHLDRFERELHPGTGMPKRFSSYVTRREGATAQEVHITMNEPMRHRGYTFYQSSWGPQKGPGRLWSQFAVVRNPSDNVPLIACLIIALGLLMHFGRKLLLHARAESRRAETRMAARAKKGVATP